MTPAEPVDFRLASVRIGPATALVRWPTFALVDLRNAHLAERMWAVLDSGGDIDELLDALSATGLRNLGDFVLAQVEPEGLRLVLRGEARATVVTLSGERTFDGTQVRTLAEESGLDHERFVLTIGPVETATDASGSPFRISAGLVPADLVAFPATDTFTLPASADGDHLRDAAHVADAVRAGRIVPPADSPPPSEPVDAPPPWQPPSADASGGLAEVSTGGETLVNARFDDRGEDPALTRVRPHRSSTEPDPPTDQLISAVPVTGPAEPSTPRLGDHDGKTMTPAQVRALREGHSTPVGSGVPPAIPSVAAGVPTVQAVLCPVQHPNPPSARTCRACGAGIVSPPVMIARPPLGRLVLSTGESVLLDRPVIIGRNPRVEGKIGTEMPNLVKIDVGQALSRSHIAVRLEGWQVFVEDQGSRNGTEVTLPNTAPMRLRGFEPVIVEHGTTIDLGGEVTARYDALAT